MLPFLKYRSVMVFDVETTGLIPKKDPLTKKMPPLDEMPHIIQLSFIIYNVAESAVSHISNSYIKLDESVLLSEFISDLTGISQDTLNTRGVSIVEALENFYKHYVTVDCVIAHNLSFDSNLIMIEVERYYHQLEQTVPQILNLFNPIFLKLKNIDTYCTMKSSIYLCNLITVSSKNPDKTYKKFPKLSELYKILFCMDAENLHNSLADSLYTLRCFLKLKMRFEMHSVKFNHLVRKVLTII